MSYKVIASVVAMCAVLCAIGIVVAACPAESAPPAQQPAQPAYITCDNGTPAPGTAVGQDIEKCADCNPGYHLEGDRCAINIFMCPNGTAGAAGTVGAPHNTQMCVACNDDYHLEGGLCVINTFACTGGTVATGVPAVHNTQMCVACHNRYHREGDRCAINAYRCDNGRAAIGASTVYPTIKCHDCNEGYHKAKDANDNDICAPNEYLECENGEAAEPGTPGGTHLGHLCAKCDPGYSLAGMLCARPGFAELVGKAEKFGSVNETAPAGLATIEDTLYMVGGGGMARGGGGRLYILDPTDGTARAVAPTVVNFGKGESNPRGLAVIDKTLYMAGDSTDSLYTVNTTDGKAEKVGSVTGFGVAGGGINSPRGLAAIGNTLYMVSADDGAEFLYTLEISGTNAGKATRVGMTAAGFGVMEGDPGGLTSIKDHDMLYMAGGDTGFLYTLDTSSGVATRAGMTAAGFGVMEDDPGGLAAIGKTLYMTGASTDALYTLAY